MGNIISKSVGILICLVCISLSSLAEEVVEGMQREKVLKILGAPKSSIKCGGKEIFYFPRGSVELENGKVKTSNLLPEEVKPPPIPIVKEKSDDPELYREAAERGDARSQVLLGFCYYSGDGIEKNLAEAVRWFRKAAEQGDAGAQYLLGLCYYIGDGILKNSAEAVRWFRKAAEQGDADAQFYLGLCYYGGKGVVQSDIQACVHYLIASALGSSDASVGARLLRKILSDEQYATAQQTATKWIEDFKQGAKQKTSAATDQIATPPVIKSSGSGFVITTNGYFLTCAHVIEKASKINVQIGDKNYTAKLIHSDKQNDVALLKLEGSGFQPTPLAQSVPEMGDKAFTVGFPNPEIQGSRAKYTEGSISALTGIKDDIRTMQITVPVQGGNSGGVLADASGNAIGLIIAQLNAVEVFKYTGTIPQNVNFAVKISYAMPLIQSVPGLSRHLPQQAKSMPSGTAIKAVEAATGLVLVYE